MKSVATFTILDSVDSTNNYAMAQVHAGLATHGSAWFTKNQFSGKGQRGKNWLSQPGENIALSIVIAPRKDFWVYPFMLNVFVANSCCRFLQKYAGAGCAIKWPNDLYLRDRKAGGILVENNFRQNIWNWSVLGIGININQEGFSPDLPNPVSLKQCTGQTYNVEDLAMELHRSVMEQIDIPYFETGDALKKYNLQLYKRNEEVTLKKQNAVFKTVVKEVNKSGQLITEDIMERVFEFGEVEWVLHS